MRSTQSNTWIIWITTESRQCELFFYINNLVALRTFWQRLLTFLLGTIFTKNCDWAWFYIVVGGPLAITSAAEGSFY